MAALHVATLAEMCEILARNTGMTHEKEQWEELRDMAARCKEIAAQPNTVGVLDLAKMLLDGVTITDPKQFRMIAHALICMNAALEESKAKASSYHWQYLKEVERYEKERARSLDRYRSMRKWAKRAKLANASVAQIKRERDAAYGRERYALRVIKTHADYLEVARKALGFDVSDKLALQKLTDEVADGIALFINERGVRPTKLYLGECRLRILRRFDPGYPAAITNGPASFMGLDIVRIGKFHDHISFG